MAMVISPTLMNSIPIKNLWNFVRKINLKKQKLLKNLVI